MKILVPCDFSKTSNQAALYATQFAKQIDAEVILLNVVHFDHPPMVQVYGFIENSINEITRADSCAECERLLKELQSKVDGSRLSYEVIQGFPLENAVEEYAVKHKVHLIIMGTKGATGLEKVLFGSNAVAIINKSSIPVLTIPQHSYFKHFNKIVYASDLHKVHSEVQKVIYFAKPFDASIDILHVVPLESKKKIDIDKLAEDLIKKYKYEKISLHLTYHDHIVEGINKYVAKVKADALAMYTHKIGFFESFVKTSYSREEAFHSALPLLTMKND